MQIKSACSHSRQLNWCSRISEAGHQVDNSVSTIQKLNTLYCEPELSDLKLLVGTKIFQTHKLILSISSDVFKTMLTSPKWPESYTSHITLQEEPECVEVFEDVLRYLYTGKINLSHVSVLPILTLADKYNIGDLSQVCIDYMCEHYVAPKNECHVISWLKYASMCCHKQLEHICEEYIIWNFQHVVETEDFLMISEEMLIKFLSSSDIVVHDEISLFKQVKRWISKEIGSMKNDHKSLCGLNAIVKKICELVHFQMMSFNDIIALQSDPVITKFHDLFYPYLDKAVQFHRSYAEHKTVHHNDSPTSPSSNLCGNTDVSQKKHPSTDTPHKKHQRIYTCDSWCTEMTVNDLESINPGEFRGAFFSTPLTGREFDDSACWDWHVDLYPKGVAFKKCLMIGLFENHEIDEVMYETVRVTVSVASSVSESRLVEVSILVFGEQDGMEYIAKVITRTCYFSQDCLLHNINNIVDYNQIHDGRSQFLMGKNKNALKFLINIRPVDV